MWPAASEIWRPWEQCTSGTLDFDQIVQKKSRELDPSDFRHRIRLENSGLDLRLSLTRPTHALATLLSRPLNILYGSSRRWSMRCLRGFSIQGLCGDKLVIASCPLLLLPTFWFCLCCTVALVCIFTLIASVVTGTNFGASGKFYVLRGENYLKTKKYNPHTCERWPSQGRTSRAVTCILPRWPCWFSAAMLWPTLLRRFDVPLVEAKLRFVALFLIVMPTTCLGSPRVSTMSTAVLSLKMVL